jgi:DNA repair protein RecO (recombination protein O)
MTTYKAVGINIKCKPFGENDRLVTIITKDHGLIQAIAPGARKHLSRFSGRSELFVVNDLLIAKGRSLDKITQAETLESYPGLTQDLAKLAASQYLAEIILSYSKDDQPQADLFELLNVHLRRIEKSSAVLPHLCHAIFHILTLAGISPQVQICCITQKPVSPDFDLPNFKVGFSIEAGGIVNLSALAEFNQLNQPHSDQNQESIPNHQETFHPSTDLSLIAIAHREKPIHLTKQLNAVELALLQQLAQADLCTDLHTKTDGDHWITVEYILRHYVQYNFGRKIRSATLLDACF